MNRVVIDFLKLLGAQSTHMDARDLCRVNEEIDRNGLIFSYIIFYVKKSVGDLSDNI